MSPELQQIFAYIGIGLSVIGVILAGIRIWTAGYPLLKARRDRGVLIDKLTRGHFDEDTIRRSTRWFIRHKFRSGAGKTTFVLNYYARDARKPRNTLCSDFVNSAM